MFTLGVRPAENDWLFSVALRPILDQVNKTPKVPRNEIARPVLRQAGLILGLKS